MLGFKPPHRPRSYGLRARLFKSKRQLYELRSPFAFISETIGRIEVGIGFLTDFGSVPTFGKSIIDDDSPDLLFASICHDDLYHRRGLLDDGRQITRAQADEMLREAMLASGAPEHVAWLVYNAVRVGNWGANW
jgi:hypothetical protein